VPFALKRTGHFSWAVATKARKAASRVESWRVMGRKEGRWFMAEMRYSLKVCKERACSPEQRQV
jgi:hypothetical protein